VVAAAEEREPLADLLEVVRPVELEPAVVPER
jgi:hypothetical protein